MLACIILGRKVWSTLVFRWMQFERPRRGALHCGPQIRSRRGTHVQTCCELWCSAKDYQHVVLSYYLSVSAKASAWSEKVWVSLQFKVPAQTSAIITNGANLPCAQVLCL
jgi:hypothetical protein